MPSEPITDERLQAIRLARAGGVAVLGEEFTTRRRKPSTLVTAAREQLLQEVTPYGYPVHRRPLAPGSTPPPTYGGSEWPAHSARYALDGATFIYGFDDMELLTLAIPEDRRWRIPALAQVELQTGCGRPYHEDGPHVCDLEGIVEAVTRNGALVFTAEGMRDIVTIPAAYVAGLTFTR
jgi:hypothetical protein